MDTMTVDSGLDRTSGTRCRYSKSASIRIDRCADDVYTYWRKLSNLPTFMRTLESVEEPYTGSTIWKRRLPGGSVVSWQAELTCDFPGNRLAWASVDETVRYESCCVRFTSCPDGAWCDVHVTMEYEAERSPAALAVAHLFRADPGAQLAAELRALKITLENDAWSCVNTPGSTSLTMAT